MNQFKSECAVITMNAKMADEEMLYTTAEIMAATGVTRGVVTSRAKLLGFQRTGQGYTEEQVYRILTMRVQKHRKDSGVITKLREKMNERMRSENIPMLITNAYGEWKLRKLNGDPADETIRKVVKV